MKLKLPERRRFVRVEVPLKLLIKVKDREQEVQTINISPVGMRFQIKEEINGENELNIKLFVPVSDEQINIKAKIVWQEKISLEDKAPFDVGVEITDICEDKKNIFLKYLCDLLYSSKNEFRS